MFKIVIWDKEIGVVNPPKPTVFLDLEEAKKLRNDLDKAIKSIESHESTSYR